jgi:hypothetical protein
METFTRDAAMYAAIFGVFSFAWFGWAQENPPKSWRVWLGVGSALGFVLGCLGGYLAARNWQAGSALQPGTGVYELFGVVVAAEILFSLIGALYLQKRGKKQLVAPWIALVVGLHFAPLATIFKDDWLYLLSLLVVLGVAVAYPLSKRLKLPFNTLACTLTGLILVVFALRGLAMFLASQ